MRAKMSVEILKVWGRQNGKLVALRIEGPGEPQALSLAGRITKVKRSLPLFPHPAQKEWGPL